MIACRDYYYFKLAKTNMDANQILGLLSRWFHIIPVISLVGGTVFMRISLVPAANQTSASSELREAVRKRWAKLVMLSILFLLVTGLYNAVTKMRGYEVPSVYGILFMVKLVVGFVVFVLSARLAGRSDKAVKFREQETKWLNIVCVLMLALVLVAGYMKFVSADVPKKDRAEKVEATAELITGLGDVGSRLETEPK